MRIFDHHLVRKKFARPLSLLASGLALGVFLTNTAVAETGADAFAKASQAYDAGHYEQAASSFGSLANVAPSAGALQNLGNAEWQLGHPGPAILAWERAQWLGANETNAHANLLFARKNRLLEAPDLSWCELCSTWLPVNAWPVIACLSFWFAAIMVICPNIFQWRKANSYQALAAAGFAIFLLTLPAMFGVHTRSKIGIVLARDTPLRLTPTSEAQTITRLAAGEAVRLEHARGRYLFIRTPAAVGWVDAAQFGLISEDR